MPAEILADIQGDLREWIAQSCPDFGEDKRYRGVQVPKMWIVHAPGGYRAIVWHERDLKRQPAVEVIWICAIGREPHMGQTGPNVYDWAKDLHDRWEPSRLLPTGEDYIEYEVERARGMRDTSLRAAGELRAHADAQGKADAAIFGIACTLSSHGDGLYQLRVPFGVGDVHIRQIIAGCFPSEDLLELDGDVGPERAWDGTFKTWTFLIE